MGTSFDQGSVIYIHSISKKLESLTVPSMEEDAEPRAPEFRIWLLGV